MRVSFLAVKLKSIVLSPHFWILLALFIVTTISHYHEWLQDVPVVGSVSITFFFGAERHTEDRLIYILLIAYAGGIFGVKVGGAILLASFVVMLSRAIFISPNQTVALFETLLAAFIGVLLLTLIRASRRIREDRDLSQMAMASLRASEEKYRELFQNASDAIWIHDLDGKMTVANKACEKMTGYNVDELVDRNVTEFLSEDALALARDVKRRLLKGEPVDERYEQRIFRRDGTEAIMELATSLITHDGQPAAFHNIARDVTAERKMRDSMRFYLQKVLVAQEEERKRIARDLHDDTGQSLLLLTHRLDAIASDPKNKLSKPVQEKLSELHSLAVESLDSLRRYAQELRPAILDDIGLIASLEWIADNLIAEDGIDVNVQVDMRERDLPHEAQLTLFRIAQEALVNIKRHAQASEVVIRLEAAAGKLTMVITDNGKGFKVPMPLSQLGSTEKLGLLGMQERAQLLSGSLNIQSELGKGTAIIVEVPLEE
ncbi:MAG: PAS domain S-box protein [Dehalococcoidia bacterium]